MGATVGLLHLKLYVGQAMNLKDKRRVIKSFKDRLANKFNVSVAEVDGQNNHRSVVLAVAMVSNDKKYIDGAFQKIVNSASVNRNMTLVDYETHWL